MLKAIEIDANNWKALWRLGQALLAADECEAAKIYLYKAARLDPKNREIRNDIETVNQRLATEKKEKMAGFYGMFNKK